MKLDVVGIVVEGVIAVAFISVDGDTVVPGSEE